MCVCSGEACPSWPTGQAGRAQAQKGLARGDGLVLLVKGMGPLWPLGPGAPRVDEGLRSPERAHEGPASLQTPTALWAWPWGLCLWPGLAPSSGGPKAPWQFEGSVGSGVDGFPHPTPGSLRASGARPGRAGCGFPVGRGCCPELATLSGQGLRRRRCQPPDQALPGHRETPPPASPPRTRFPQCSSKPRGPGAISTDWSLLWTQGPGGSPAPSEAS